MIVRLIVATATLLMLTSCAPKFTVYIDLAGKMNTDGVTVLSIDTTDVSGYKQKRVRYAITRDMGKIESSISKRKQRKIKIEVDKISR